MTALFYQNQSVLARAALEQNAYVINTPIPFGMLYPRLEVALDGLNKLKRIILVCIKRPIRLY
ncbi:MAG: hypothetical protein HWD59_08575 [Coxiellaceae bacterium]|nr:MAG: hypothetical protein HWD59_08575 [Coxiellaceae bacterium]